jgi:endoglucanase
LVFGRRASAAVATTVALLLGSAMISTGTPASAATGHVLWTVHPGPTHKLPNNDNRSYIQAVEKQVGRNFDLDVRYYLVGKDQIVGAREQWALANGETPLIHLSLRSDLPYTWKTITAGAADTYLKQQAIAAANFGKTATSPAKLIYLNFQNEADHNKSWAGTPADFIAAFQHVVNVFRSNGASNVQFVLSLFTNPGVPMSEFAKWYPGDAYVDAFGPTGYNWACSPGYGAGQKGCGKNWHSFQQVFSTAYAFAVLHGKALFVTETGTAEDPASPGRKAQWIRDMATTAKSWPNLKAIVWFQAGKRGQVFAVSTSPSALQAFTCVGHDPYFGGTGPSC